MRQQKLMSVLVSSLLLTGGCGIVAERSPFADQADYSSDAAWLASASSGNSQGDSARRFSRRRHGEGLTIADDAGPDDYVALALQRNPVLLAARHKVARMSERITQATSLDDPMFNLAPIGEMAETAAGQAGLMAGVSQKLPFPGKLDTRGRIASQMVAVAAQDLESVRLQVVAETRQAYWSHYLAVRAIEVTEQNRNLVAQFREIAQAKNKVGAAGQQDVLRASVELSSLDTELITWRQRRATAAAMINSLIDLSVTTPIPEPSRVELESIGLDFDRLLVDAERTNPTIRKIRERIEGSRQQLKLARLNRYPDVTAMLNYVAVDDEGLSPVANGKDQWWLGLGINLSVWTDKLDAAENEARHGILEGLADRFARHGVTARIEQVSDRFSIWFGVPKDVRITRPIWDAQCERDLVQFTRAAHRHGVFMRPQSHHGISLAHTEDVLAVALDRLNAALRDFVSEIYT